MIILEENFKWHLEAFASELFKFKLIALIPDIEGLVSRGSLCIYVLCLMLCTGTG